MQQIILRTLVIAALTLTPGALSAHALGVSLEKVAGEYLVDVGYDPIVLLESENAIFDISLRDADTKDIVAFDFAWVRIVQDRSTVLATGIMRQTLGPTTLVYRFPEAGEYELEISYRTNEGETIAAASFPLRVQSEREFVSWYYVVSGIAAAVLIGAFFVWNRRSRRPSI